MSKFYDNKIRPMYFWSQKVLPLVFDESLSYYEVLNKTIDKLNDVIEIINDELENYVRARIDELFTGATYDSENERIILTLGGDDNG